MAVGGTQTVRLIDLNTLEPLEQPWEAKVTSDKFELSDLRENTLRIRALGASRASLRIVDARNGELYDRHAIASAMLTRVELSPRYEILAEPAPPLAWIAGSEIDANVRLYANDERLIDDSMRLEVLNAVGAAVTQPAWDRFTVQNAALGNVELSVTAGTARDLRLPIAIVDGIDGIVPGKVNTFYAGETGLVCFETRRGDATVLGLKWTFATEPPSERDISSLSPNCAFLQPQAEGRLIVIGSTAGQSTRIAVDVLPPRAMPRAAAPDSAPDQGSLGERARALQ